MTTTQLRPPGVQDFRMAIGGAAVDAGSGRTYESIDPYTGQPWARVPDAGPQDVRAAVDAARAALNGPWGALTATARRLLDQLEPLRTG